jgi:hypothetical protein
LDSCACGVERKGSRLELTPPPSAVLLGGPIPIEVPPFIVGTFRADALTVFDLAIRWSDAKSLVVGGSVYQPQVAVLATMHGILSHSDRGVR